MSIRAVLGLNSFVVLAAAVLLAAAAPAILAKQQPDVEKRRSELDDLKGRIGSLRKEMSQAEESRADVADQLEDTERAISAADRRLRQLTEQRGAAQRDLAALAAQAQLLEKRVAMQQGQLARLLRNRYEDGESESLQHLLRGGDPNQVARDTFYLARLARAQADVIVELRRSLSAKRDLAQKVADKTEELTSIEKAQQKERAELLGQQQKRRAVLERIAGEIKVRRKEIDSLKRDEKRLTRLIDALGRIVKKPPRAGAVRGRGDQTPPGPAVAQPARKAPAPGSVTHNDQIPDESLGSRAFARMKGLLRLPTRGELINRFGAPRQEGGTSWKGLFIRAPQGVEVRAIAPGRVVFAEWLRGFGNLIILDHGDSYMSVYGNNESVFKAVGEEVRAGETIAAVGNSGGNADSGLYFELRHQGQPLDPMKWVNLK